MTLTMDREPHIGSIGGTTPLTPRVGSPSRGAILTALASAAVRVGDLKGILTLARTGRPRSLIGCGGLFRWLALDGLLALYPEANRDALCAALGCRASTDPRGRADKRRASLDPGSIHAVARDVAENEDAYLTASFVWPIACAVTAAHTGVDPDVVRTPTGERTSQPRAVSLARQMAVYLTMTEGDVNATAMAAATGLEKKTVRHGVAAMEDRRDEDPALDDVLTTLAAVLGDRLNQELSQW